MEDDQIVLMNTYVRKQEEFTVELLRRLLETNAKYDILEKSSKNTADLFATVSDVAGKSTIEIEKLKDLNIKLQTDSDKYQILLKDFDTLTYNYHLAMDEVNRLTGIRDKFEKQIKDMKKVEEEKLQLAANSVKIKKKSTKKDQKDQKDLEDSKNQENQWEY